MAVGAHGAAHADRWPVLQVAPRAFVAHGVILLVADHACFFDFPYLLRVVRAVAGHSSAAAASVGEVFAHAG